MMTTGNDFGRIDELLDSLGVPVERDKADEALLDWFEAETGLILPPDFRHALPRMHRFDEVLVAIPWNRWAVWGLGRVLGPVVRDRSTGELRYPILLKDLLEAWAEREMEHVWYRERRSWVESQLLPFAWNSDEYFCFDYRFDPQNPPVIRFDPLGSEDSNRQLVVPVDYVAPSFTVLLERAVRYKELEGAPYTPTAQHLAWNVYR